MAKLLSSLSVGDKVKLGSIYGEAITWLVVDKNHSGYPSNSVTLVTEKIIKICAFDAQETNNTISDRKNYGNNDYKLSNIHQWLNSSSSAGNWWSSTHTYDTSPAKARCNNYNGYDTEAGFLNAWTTDERNALLSTTLPFSGYSNNNTSTTGKVFLLSSTELGLETVSGNGTAISYFNSNAKRQAYPTEKAVSNSDYTNSSLKATSTWWWWTRTGYSSNSYNVRYVNTDGTLNSHYACNGHNGVRPACNLSSSISISDSPDSSGAYTIIYNKAPNAPSTINVPEPFRSGVANKITWSAATDPDGDTVGYTLQRALNGGGYSQVYKGSATNYSDTVEKGSTSVQYRVQAYDTKNATSSWKTSSLVTVINNAAPKIAGIDKNLGTFSMAAPSISYTVTDEDNDAVTVTEYFDEQVLQSRQVQLGEANSIIFSQNEWLRVTNGEHAIKVKAEDSEGNVTEHEASFTKKVDVIDVQLSEPMISYEMPTVCLINVSAEVPDGATMKVEVCNNAYDDAPFWEDVTENAKNRIKYWFQNTAKTDEDWAVNVRVHIERGDAEGDVYLESIGGNFG